MRYLTNTLIMLLATISTTVFASDSTPASSHDVAYPAGWENWATIAVSHRTDNNTIRTILGNDIAVEAARSGNIKTWPDGSIIGKVVWKDAQLEDWKAATVPGTFVHAEFMFKDSKKYSDTYNWAGHDGWA